MAMKKLLLVDADPLSLCVLEVSLRKAGYRVTTAGDGVEALEKIESIAPHLVLTETRLPKLDGYALVRNLKERPEASDTPVIFMGSHDSLEDRRRAHELGVEEFLAKPIFLAELIARINLVLARRTRESVSGRHSSTSGRDRFAGSTQDLALVDLLRNFELSRRTGVLDLRNGVQEAHIYFREGKAIDADLGTLRGEEAIFRTLMWGEASFEIELKAISNEDVVDGSTSAVVQRGMQRVDEWVRLCEQVQSLAALLDIHPPELLERLSRLTQIPDSLHGLLRLSPAPDVRPALPQGANALKVRTAPAAIADAPDRTVAASVASPVSPPVPKSVTAAPSPIAQAVSAIPIDSVASAVSVAPRMSSVAAAVSPPAAAMPPARPATAPPAPVVQAAPKPAAPLAAASPPPSAPPPTSVARPSDAPWSREVALADEHAADADAIAAGVPRAIGATTKRVLGTAFAAAAILFLVVGLNSVRSRQLREAEAARSSNGLSAAAAAAPPPVAQPVALPSSTARPAQEAPAAAAPEATAKAQPEGAGATVARPGPDSMGAPAVAAAPVIAGGPALTAMAAPERVVRETSLGATLSGRGQLPLVGDAERALLRGQTERALTLAHQAVAENATVAEAWLTLAAAQKASGDFAGARDSYRSCLNQAQTVGLDHCRVLAASER
jgi:DNA-binding response OmpR family regulator